MMTDTAGTGWTGGQKAVGDIAPALANYTDRVLFDDVWERSELLTTDEALPVAAPVTRIRAMPVPARAPDLSQ